MHQIGQYAPPVWRAALFEARKQQARHIGILLRNLLPKTDTGKRVRWAFLLIVSLLAAGLVARHGYHIEIIMGAIVLASLVSGIAGFAFSAICGAMLFHLSDDPVQVVQIMVTCSIANQAAMTWAGRHEIVWRQLSIYLVGGALGLSIGIWMLLNADRALYAHGLGLFLLGYGAYMLARRPIVVRCQHGVLDCASGFLGGITGGALGFPGAFVSIWCGMKGWDKASQRGVVQPFILIMQIATLVAISFCHRPGASGIGFDIGDLLFVPASLFGTSLGLAVYRRLSDLQFARAVSILLIVSGLSYVV
jgi:uncharacterized protein